MNEIKQIREALAKAEQFQIEDEVSKALEPAYSALDRLEELTNKEEK